MKPCAGYEGRSEGGLMITSHNQSICLGGPGAGKEKIAGFVDDPCVGVSRTAGTKHID